MFLNFGKLILASASPRRKELLEKANIDFEVIISGAEELKFGLEPESLVKHNAFLKAEFVAKKFPSRVVLGVDTIVVLGDEIIGKPKDISDALKILARMQGKQHSVYTAIALICLDKKIEIIDYEKSFVLFKNLTSEQISEYVKKVNVLDKAGAYAVQEHGEFIIEKIEGNFDNVMGLPCDLLKNKLDTINALCNI